MSRPMFLQRRQWIVQRNAIRVALNNVNMILSATASQCGSPFVIWMSLTVGQHSFPNDLVAARADFGSMRRLRGLLPIFPYFERPKDKDLDVWMTVLIDPCQWQQLRRRYRR